MDSSPRPPSPLKKASVFFIKFISLTNFSRRGKGQKGRERLAGDLPEGGGGRLADSGWWAGCEGGARVTQRSRDRRAPKWAPSGCQSWLPAVGPGAVWEPLIVAPGSFRSV